jgi:hypothetical protein
MSPITGPDGPDLKLVHDIDEAQAASFERIDNFLDLINDWLCNQGYSEEEMADALDDPMMFYAILKIMQQKVDVRQMANMLAAALIRIAKELREG